MKRRIEVQKQTFYGPVTMIVQPPRRRRVGLTLTFVTVGRTNDGRVTTHTGPRVAMKAPRGEIMSVIRDNQRVRISLKAPLDDRGVQTKISAEVTSSDTNVVQIEGAPTPGQAVAQIDFSYAAAHAVADPDETPQLGSAVVTCVIKQEDGDELQTLTFAVDVMAQDATTVEMTESAPEVVPLP